MNPFFARKTAFAAAVLLATAGLAFAQTTTTPNTTTSPNPLQTNPSEGEPSSANGKMTPGTGTGSSRTMRNPDSNTPTNTDAATPTTSNSSANGMPTNDGMRNTAPVVAPGQTGNGGSATPVMREARRDRG